MRTDDPTRTSEIAAFPITDVLAIPDRELVVFADFPDLIAYGRDGILWRFSRVGLHELEIIRAEGDVLHVAGIFAGVHQTEFTVDLRTGRPSGGPYEFDVWV